MNDDCLTSQNQHVLLPKQDKILFSYLLFMVKQCLNINFGTNAISGQDGPIFPTFRQFRAGWFRASGNKQCMLIFRPVFIEFQDEIVFAFTDQDGHVFLLDELEHG